MSHPSLEFTSALSLVACRYRAIKACDDSIKKKQEEIEKLRDTIDKFHDAELVKNLKGIIPYGGKLSLVKGFNFDAGEEDSSESKFRICNTLVWKSGVIQLEWVRNGHNKYTRLSDLSPKIVLDLLEHILKNRIS